MLRFVLAALALSACRFADLVPHGGTDSSVADVPLDDAPDGNDGTSCAPLGMPTGTSAHAIDVAGTPRSFVLVVPQTYDSNRRYPLVYAAPSYETASAARTRYVLDAVLGEDAIVVYPEKPVPVTEPWDLTLTSPNFALYDGIQTWARASYCIGKIYAFGYGNGAGYANALGCYRGGDAASDVVGVVSVNGYTNTVAADCIRPAISAAVVHNTDNDLYPISDGMQVRDLWKGKAACGPASVSVAGLPCISYEGCAPPSNVLWCPTGAPSHDYPAEAPAIAAHLIGLAL